MFRQHAAREQADGGTRSRCRDEQPDPNGRSPAGGPIASDTDGQRAEPGPRTLHGASRDQAANRTRQGAHQRSGGERRDGEEQQPTLPVHVAEPPKQRDGGDCCEQVRGLEPRGRGERRLVGALNRGQDRKDHELLESQVESTHSQHPRCGAITLDEGTTVHQAQSLIAAGIRRLTFFHIFVRLRE
jgi:hypothetical protein